MDFLDNIKEKVNDIFADKGDESGDFVNEFKDLYNDDPKTAILFILAVVLVLALIVFVCSLIRKGNRSGNSKKIKYEDIDWNIHRETEASQQADETPGPEVKINETDIAASKQGPISDQKTEDFGPVRQAENYESNQQPEIYEPTQQPEIPEPVRQTQNQGYVQPVQIPEPFQQNQTDNQVTSIDIPEPVRQVDAPKTAYANADQRNSYYDISEIMAEFDAYDNDEYASAVTVTNVQGNARTDAVDERQNAFNPPFRQEPATESRPRLIERPSSNRYFETSDEAKSIYNEAISSKTLEMEPISNAMIAKNIMQSRGLTAQDEMPGRLRESLNKASYNEPDTLTGINAQVDAPEGNPGLVRVEQINLIKAVPSRKYGADNKDTNRAGRIFTEEELIKQIRE